VIFLKPWVLFVLMYLYIGSVHAAIGPVTQVAFMNSQSIRLTAQLFQTTWSGPRQTVVMMHGCSGIYSLSDPAKGLAKLYLEWAARLNHNGFHALLIDSFTPRGVAQNQCANGSAGVSEVSDRPRDAEAGAQWLSQQPFVNPEGLAILGWSHGASSVISTLSNTVEIKNRRFKTGIAFYPGCGLYNAFGGISTSTYVSYAPLMNLHGDADPLYISGNCQTRVANAESISSKTLMKMIVYSGAKHSFDNARTIDANWTSFDVNAKTAADAEVMRRLALLPS